MTIAGRTPGFVRFFATFATLSVAFAGNLFAADPTEAKAALDQVVRSLDSCSVVALTAGDQRKLVMTGDSASSDSRGRAQLIQGWFNSNGAQFIITDADFDGASDNELAALTEPLTSETAMASPGLKVCVRTSGELGAMELRPVSDTTGITGMYSARRKASVIQSLPIPLIGLRRDWMPKRQVGAFLAIDHVANLPLSAWHFSKREAHEGSDTNVFEVERSQAARFELKRHQGELAVTPLWKVWCDDKDGIPIPVRIEASARYEYGGNRYEGRLSEGGPSSVTVFTATDYRKIADRSYYPFSGTERTYEPIPGGEPLFDPDDVVDQLLNNGFYFDDTKLQIATERKWKIRSIRQEPYRDDLWIDAPSGVLVHIEDTDERFFAGMSKKDSDALLNDPIVGTQDLPAADVPTPSGRGRIYLLISSSIAIAMAGYFCLRGKR